MKTLFNFIIAILFSLIAFINTNAMSIPTDDRTYAIDTLTINVPAEIHFYKADTFGIAIKAANKYIQNNIHWDLKDQNLTIDFDNIDMIKRQVIDSEDVRINIELPEKVKCIKTSSDLQVKKSI